MPKYRFTIRSEWLTTTEIEADTEAEAIVEMDLYLQDGGIGDDEKGYWNTRDYDDPEELCKFCNEPVKQVLGLVCCRAWVEEKIKTKEGTK